MSERKYRHRGYMEDYHDERERRRGPRGYGSRLDGAPRGRSAGLPTQDVFKCAVCGRRIQLLGTLEMDAACPSCGKPLHTCTNCAYFDPSAPFECRKPVKARVENKSAKNQCTFFKPALVKEYSSASGPSTPDEARAAFDALFKKL